MSKKGGITVLTKETNKKSVTYSIEQVDDTYTIYMTMYGEREDFLIYSTDYEYIEKMLNFMVYSFNEGMNTGKNEALMFNM